MITRREDPRTVYNNTVQRIIKAISPEYNLYTYPSGNEIYHNGSCIGRIIVVAATNEIGVFGNTDLTTPVAELIDQSGMDVIIYG